MPRLIEADQLDWEKVVKEHQLREHLRHARALEHIVSRGTRVIKPGRGYKVLGLAPDHKDSVEAPISTSGLAARREELKAQWKSVSQLMRYLRIKQLPR